MTPTDQKIRECAKEIAIAAFTLGNQRGHESTVEGTFIPVHQNDAKTYFEDVVEDAIKDGAIPVSEILSRHFAAEPKPDKTLEEIVEKAFCELAAIRFDRAGREIYSEATPMQLEEAVIRQACLEYSATLQRDKERLDWLEKSETYPAYSSWKLNNEERNHTITLCEVGGFVEAKSIRQAIDVAQTKGVE